MDKIGSKRAMPESLRTSDRKSFMRYMGLPIHIFGEVSQELAHARDGGKLFCSQVVQFCITGRVLPTVSATAADPYAQGVQLACWHKQQHFQAAEGLRD